jgi:hypothetical protein
MNSLRPPADTPRAEIHLGDLARAIALMRPMDPATLAAIAGALGYGLRSERIVPAPQASPPSGQASPAAMAPKRLPPEAPPAPPREPKLPPTPPPERPPPESPPAPARPRAVSLTPRRPPEAVRRVEDVLHGPALPTQLPAARWRQPPSLFKPETVRSIVFLALATEAHEAEIDVEALARFLTFQEPWNGELPRLPRSTLRRGVQVVIDRRLSMSPFYGDQNALFEVIRNVVGADRSTYATFQTTPDYVMAHDSMQLRPYQAPPAGTPVLLLSNLSIGHAIGDSIPANAWLTFARRVRKAGCPIFAFVPYPASRWPVALTRRLALIQWDRPATPGGVRRRVGTGHEAIR